MREYLVNYDGKWHIALPACSMKEHEYFLCWCERNGSVICFAGEENEVRIIE
jgi:hypothetical protein